MTTYNTGNPIGSTDPRDLYDNAENLDVAVNGTNAVPWMDRLGRLRMSYAGIEHSASSVLASLGYAVPMPYEAGLTMDSANQTVSYGGETYAPRFNQLPFTTSGTFEADKFRLIQGVSGADLAADYGAAMVGFIQEGVGAVTRTAQDKLREMVSVKDFGADPLGEVDSTEALQRAVEYGDTYVPEGVYLISAAIQLPSNRRVTLSSRAVLKRNPAQVGNNFRIFNFANTHNTVIEGGSLDLNHASAFGTGIRFSTGLNKNCAIIGVNFFDSNPDLTTTGDKWAISLGSGVSKLMNVLIDRCSLNDTDNSWGGTSSDMQLTANGGGGGDNITISRSYAYLPVVNGISMTYGYNSGGSAAVIRNLQVLHNYVYGPKGLGIVVGRDDGGTPSEDDEILGVTLAHNTIDMMQSNTGSIGIGVRPADSNTKGIRLLYNTVICDPDTTQTPLRLTDSIPGSTQGSKWFDDVEVVGNHFGPRSSTIGFIRSGVIRDNVFEGLTNLTHTQDCALTDNRFSRYLYVYGSKRLLIGAGNRWTNIGGAGISNRAILIRPESGHYFSEADVRIIGCIVSNDAGEGALEQFTEVDASRGGTFKVDVIDCDIRNTTQNPLKTVAGGSYREVRGNRGYKNANGGTSPAISSGGKIAHGLVGKPDVFSVTPTGAAENVRVSAGTTYLTVEFDGGGSVPFSWEAKMQNYYG